MIDTLVPFFNAGLQSDEFCVWAVSDPLTKEEAHASLASNIRDYQRYVDAGCIEIVDGNEWYLSQDLKKVTYGWHEKEQAALARGMTGMRASGIAFWLETKYRDDFLAYEQELDASLAGHSLLILCTYPVRASFAADVIDVAHAHQLTAIRRNGEWSFIAAAGSPSHHSLTLREVEVLTWVARGKSAWEIGKILNITKRTVDEHARSSTQKLGASNRTEAATIALDRHIIELNTKVRTARMR